MFEVVKIDGINYIRHDSGKWYMLSYRTDSLALYVLGNVSKQAAESPNRLASIMKYNMRDTREEVKLIPLSADHPGLD